MSHYHMEGLCTFLFKFSRKTQNVLLFSFIIVKGFPWFWRGMCRALLCSDDSSHSQSQSGKRLLLASRGHPARAPAYQGSCIDPTHQPNTLDPTPDLSFPITDITIRLLIKDANFYSFFLSLWANRKIQVARISGRTWEMRRHNGRVVRWRSSTGVT